MKKPTTLILGASSKPERYAYMAAERLLAHGHTIKLLGAKKDKVLGHEISNEKSEINGSIDTVTMYLSPKNASLYHDFIISLKPKRVIFNPGTEDDLFKEKLEKENIEALEACTLVMLGTGQY